jgi:hypothetical protein
MRTPVLFLITLTACGMGGPSDPGQRQPIGADAGARLSVPDGAGRISAPPDAVPAPVTPDATPPASPDAPPSATNDPARHFVTASLVVPATSKDATALAFDLDGNGSPDNSLGNVLAILSGQVDVTGYVKEALEAGTFVILHSLRVTDGDASWQVYVGDPHPAPDLKSGSGTFTVAAASPLDAVVTGTLADGHFEGGPSPIVLTIALGSDTPPITLHLLAAHVAADVTDGGCANGRVGGGVPLTDVHGTIIPAVAAALDAQIGKDGDCRTNAADCSNADTLVLSFLDTNGDRHITADEIEGNFLVALFLRPDVDLLDADGNPGQDGVKESMSLGLGFTCTDAVFAAPNE